MQAHMIYKVLERAATASLTCIQFAFFLFTGSSAAEDLLASGSSTNWWSCSTTSGSLVSLQPVRHCQR
jgi:hypothetical protein